MILASSSDQFGAVADVDGALRDPAEPEKTRCGVGCYQTICISGVKWQSIAYPCAVSY
jgi:hypothetical protein